MGRLTEILVAYCNLLTTISSCKHFLVIKACVVIKYFLNDKFTMIIQTLVPYR